MGLTVGAPRAGPLERSPRSLDRDADWSESRPRMSRLSFCGPERVSPGRYAPRDTGTSADRRLPD